MNALTIKSRLVLLAVLAAVGMLVMAAIQFNALRNVESLGKARHLVAEIESDMLMQRRNEKDFLARKDLKYKARFIENARAMQAHIRELQAVLEDKHIDTTPGIGVADISREYQQKFLALVDLQKRVGLNHKDGLYGSLRDAVHRAEDLIGALNDDRLSKDMLMLRRREKDFMLRLDLKYLKKFDHDLAVFFSDLQRSGHPDEVKQRIKSAMDKYQQDFHSLVDAEKAMGLSSDRGLRGAMRAKIRASEGLLKKLSAETGSLIEEALHGHRTWPILAAGLGTLMIIALVAMIAIGIVRPVEHLAGIMTRASKEHDLGLRASIHGRDEISRMARVFNGMMAEFETLMRAVMDSSARLGTAAEDLTAITHAGRQGAARQSVETEQVAAAMQQMTATVREVASNASHAAGASGTADQETHSSKEVVKENMRSIGALADEVQNTSRTITELSEESENIGAVLNVIRDIADQTNLLALNAAIEAARAGEQGRGFAVVADEVRSLAQRSQQSTQEIQEIVERLQRRSAQAVAAMEQGTRKAQDSVTKAESVGGSLDTIAEAVSTINNMNMQIASAAEEQASVSEEVGRNVTNINQIANDSAENIRQISATSDALLGLAKQLQDSVAHFRLG